MNDVIVYTKKPCVQCNATIKDLTKRGIPFRTVDVSQDDEARDRILGMGYLTAPVVTVDGDSDHWGGHRPSKIEQLERSIRQQKSA